LGALLLVAGVALLTIVEGVLAVVAVVRVDVLEGADATAGIPVSLLVTLFEAVAVKVGA